MEISEHEINIPGDVLCRGDTWQTQVPLLDICSVLLSRLRIESSFEVRVGGVEQSLRHLVPYVHFLHVGELLPFGMLAHENTSQSVGMVQHELLGGRALTRTGIAGFVELLKDREPSEDVLAGSVAPRFHAICEPLS